MEFIEEKKGKNLVILSLCVEKYRHLTKSEDFKKEIALVGETP